MIAAFYNVRWEKSKRKKDRTGKKKQNGTFFRQKNDRGQAILKAHRGAERARGGRDMEVLTRTNGREMTLAISGELDHHGAHGAMQQIDHALDAALPLSLTMDLSGVSFMDSSGIAVVLRAHRRMAALGGSLIVTGVPAQARKVFDAAGVPRLVTMQ